MNSNKVHVLKLSDIRGWSMLCEDAGIILLFSFPVIKLISDVPDHYVSFEIF